MHRADWPVVAAAGVLAALALGGWFVPRSVPVGAASAVAAQTNAAAIPASAAASRPVLNPAALRLQRGPDDVRLCGGAWVRSGADHQVDPRDLAVAVDAAAVGERFETSLRADRSPRAHGLALYFDIVEAGLRAEASQPRCEGDDCAPSPPTQPWLDAVDALARFAMTSGDPQVYAWALRTCGTRITAGPCAALSVAQWSHLDPDNAAPWLAVLAAASARHDAAAADEALHRIATARRNDAGGSAMWRVVLDHLGTDERDLAANQVVTIAVTGLQAAWSAPGYQTLSGMCRGEALRDPNRQQVCDGVAETLAQRSDDLLTQWIGAQLGERLGWPADRVDRLNGERQAFSAASLAHRPELDLGHGLVGSCADLHRLMHRLRDTAERGEAGLMREWLAQSGQSTEDHVRLGRKMRLSRDANIAAAKARAAAPAATSSGAN